MISPSAFSADALLAELLEWVRIESPTYDPAAVNRMLDFMAPRIGAFGFSVERLPGRDSLGDMLRCRLERFLLDVNRNGHGGFPRSRKSDSSALSTAAEGCHGEGLLERLARACG